MYGGRAWTAGKVELLPQPHSAVPMLVRFDAYTGLRRRLVASTLAAWDLLRGTSGGGRVCNEASATSSRRKGPWTAGCARRA